VAGVEPCDGEAILPADAVVAEKLAAGQNLAIRLHGEGKDLAAGVRVERIGHTGSGIEPGDTVA
jgi:hypothetical protein